MKFAYIIFLFLFIVLKGLSQSCYDEEDKNPRLVRTQHLDNEIEMIGGKKKALKLFQKKMIFPIELKDTICKILDSEVIYIRVFIGLDTSGKAEYLNAWCNEYPFVLKFVEDMLEKYLPDFTPPIYRSKKVKTQFYYAFALSTKEKMKNAPQAAAHYYRLYPIFRDLNRKMK